MPVQTATIVVTDLVASTPLRAMLGEERADDVRRAHDHALAAAAEEGGGSVVKHLGDGLMVLFAGSAEALTGAIAMQQALELVSREEHVDLTMRIGVSAGDVTLEGGDCFGTPVVEATRLCDAAGGGQILVAEQVRLLSRGRGGLELDPIGTLELKGLSEAIDAWSLRWAPARTRADLRSETPFVGRANERALLAERAASARDGRGGLVLVAGEPGIGKTRLVRELCDDLEDALVLWGGCHEGEVLANAPFVEALTAWCRLASPDVVRHAFGPDAVVLSRLVPSVRDLLTDLDDLPAIAPDEAVSQLHDAVNQLLARLTEDRPVVLVVDDLHWADDAAIGTLRSVARRAHTLALLVIGTYRETDLDRRHPLAQALPLLRREAEVMRIGLDGLAAGDIHHLLEQLTGQKLRGRFSEIITEHTAGNPFFVRETLLDLVDSQRARFEDGAWIVDSGDLGIAEGIREVIGRRLSQLSPTTNQLLHVAALFDASFPLATAAEVAQVLDDDALDAVDEALAARVIRATEIPDNYTFAHALFRQTLVEELNPSRQVRMHRAIADALANGLRGEPSLEQAATLMRHFERSAALPGSERGVHYALAVANHAASRYASREEYDALVVARELDPDGVDADLAEQTMRAACLAQLDATLLAEECTRAGALIAAADGGDAAADAVAEALDAGYQVIEPTTRWRIAEIARRWLRPERRDVVWVALRALELNERDLQDPEYPGIIVDDAEWAEVRRVALAHYGDEHLVNTSRYIGPIGREELEALPKPYAPRALRPFGSYGDFRTHLDAILAELDRPETRRSIPRFVLWLALAARIETPLGRHDNAAAHLDEASFLLPRLDPASNEVFQVLGAIAMRSRVCGEEVSVPDVDELERLAENPDTSWAATVVRAGKAIVLARAGDAAAAIATVEDCLPGIERAPGWAINYPMIVGFAAEVLFETQRTDHLDVIERNVRSKVLEPEFRYPEADARWSLAQLCAVSGRPDEARAWFTDARRELTDQGLAALLVNLDVDEATMEARFGNCDRAQALLDAARAGCTHPAMDPWFTRIEALEAKFA